MKCFYHPEVDAVAICKNCHKAICKGCLVEVKNGMACKESADDCVIEVQRLDRFLERSKIAAESTRSAFSRSIIFLGIIGVSFFLVGLVSIALNPSRFLAYILPLIIGVAFLLLTWYNYSESKKYEMVEYEYEDVAANEG